MNGLQIPENIKINMLIIVAHILSIWYD